MVESSTANRIEIMNNQGRPKIRRVVAIVILVAVLVGSALVLRAANQARANAARNACRCSLAAILGAKDQWALENRASVGSQIPQGALTNYIKGSLPSCSKGGVFTIGRIGEAAVCSVAGHTMALSDNHRH